jgi:hypothetical protein
MRKQFTQEQLDWQKKIQEYSWMGYTSRNNLPAPGSPRHLELSRKGSAAARNKLLEMNNTPFTCPHCLRESKGYTFRSFHFDNCPIKDWPIEEVLSDLGTMIYDELTKKYGVGINFLHKLKKSHNMRKWVLS